MIKEFYFELCTYAYLILDALFAIIYNTPDEMMVLIPRLIHYITRTFEMLINDYFTRKE